jgi:hypothetical protein
MLSISVLTAYSISLRFSPSSLFAATHIIVDGAQTIQQKKKDTPPLLASAPIPGK